MPELHIIGGPQSNYVWMTRVACAEKGVPYTLIPVMPHTPEVDAIHPLGKIPVLRHGDVTLCESRAICFYIDHKFDGPPLAPRDALDGARAEQWVSLVNTSIDPVLVRQYLRGYFFPGTPDGKPDRELIDGALPKIEQHFGLLDRAVAKTGYLVGKSFTLADMNLMPMLYYASKLPESAAMLGQAANLKTYFERHLARESVAATIPPPMPSRR